MTRLIVTADIGGTHARFALATLDQGRVTELGAPVTLRTAEHLSFERAWEELGRRLGTALPDELAIAVAAPIDGDVVKLTNNPWVIDLAAMRQRLGLARMTVLNDFGAVAHAVAALPPEHFHHLCGPDQPLPSAGVISIVGPGTGLGVAALLRSAIGYQVIETEGGHIDFAPLDAIEDRILVELRRKFRRVSVERIASGQGLSNLYEALTTIEGSNRQLHDERALWDAALAGTDPLATAALDRLVLSLGAVAGDIALAHGASAVVIGGGLGLRLEKQLCRPAFGDRLAGKGRYEARMRALPVKLITHPQPGLFGAASAHAARF